jgi:hypothetical protein
MRFNAACRPGTAVDISGQYRFYAQIAAGTNFPQGKAEKALLQRSKR